MLAEVDGLGDGAAGPLPVVRGGHHVWPVTELLRARAVDRRRRAGRRQGQAGGGARRRGARRTDRQRLAGLLGLAELRDGAEELPWAVRRLLETLARERPLVVLLDDLHWAEPTLLDLVDHVADWSREAPILLCCLARPELLDARPGWGGGKFNASSLLLQPLDAADSERLVEQLLGRAILAEAARRHIVETAEGNPLFVEELLGMLIDDGLLVRSDGGWAPTTDLSVVPVPTSIATLLTARMEQLDQEERAVVGRASVIGQTFYRDAVAELSAGADPQAVGSHLSGWCAGSCAAGGLGRRGQEASASASAAPRRRLRRLPSAPRRAARASRLVERTAGERLASTGCSPTTWNGLRLRSELGPVDAHGRALAARRGVAHQASRRALALGDMPAVAKRLRRAAELLPSTRRAARSCWSTRGAARRRPSRPTRVADAAARSTAADPGAHAVRWTASAPLRARREQRATTRWAEAERAIAA